MRFAIFVITLIISSTSHSQWTKYPEDLLQFDYSGEKLQQYWPQLAAATGLAWPDADFISSMMKEFPQLAQQLQLLAKSEHAPAALKASLNNDYQGLAIEVQQVWRLHFQGQYEEAYLLGKSLGPAGLGPALYAKLIYTTHLITDAQEKESLFLQVDQVITELLPHANGYRFILFGDAYQKARRLELMSTAAATASGLLGPTQDNLKELHKNAPNNPLYSAMLAGIDAGIIERVGNFVGGMTYGADEDTAIELFQQALKSQPNLAVLYNEFAQVILRLNDSDYDEILMSTLTTCDRLIVYSAEEALNQKTCRALLRQLK